MEENTLNHCVSLYQTTVKWLVRRYTMLVNVFVHLTQCALEAVSGLTGSISLFYLK